MDNNNEEVIYSGPLKKKGGRVNVWGERYFVLKGYTLYYYVKSTDSVRYFSIVSHSKTCRKAFLSDFVNRSPRDHFRCKLQVPFLPLLKILIKSESSLPSGLLGKSMTKTKKTTTLRLKAKMVTSRKARRRTKRTTRVCPAARSPRWPSAEWWWVPSPLEWVCLQA